MMALLFWQNAAALCARTDPPADGGPVRERGKPVVVGHVTVEYDAGGHPHSDGRFYPDHSDADSIAARRNQGDPDPLDKWWVLDVIATDPAAIEAAALAAQLRTGTTTENTQPGRAET